jgi:hypothetical protein
MDVVLGFDPGESPEGEEGEFLPAAEKIWICAEELVNLYMSSDSVYSIFPPGSEFDYHFETTRDCPIAHRVRVDAENRARLLPAPVFPFDAEAHDRVLGESLREGDRPRILQQYD